MKICPVCNDSFTDELNFCDIDGARLAREGAVQERNKWWSLIGVGLLVGALVISAASILFLPKARVSSPSVNSEPQPTPSLPKAPSAESAANVSAPVVSAEPEIASADTVVPEVRKKDKAPANANVGGAAPNPKAAALAAEDADKGSPSADANRTAPSPPKNPEAPPAVKTVSDARPAEAAKPQPPSDLKKDQKAQPTIAKSSDKDSNDKKKNDDKDKKKGGGFLRVFKKIFGKD
ncbi:MAG: hypothetical protein AABO57_28870 [Acidobacteriota bacterium]